MPTLVSRHGWGARAPRSSIPTTSWSQRVGFAIHHSAGPTGQTVRQIQNHQMDNNGWSDIGYNWLVDQSGKVYYGRDGGWLAIGAHAANQNTAWIGVCWIGNSGNVAPSKAALSSIKWLYNMANQLAGRRLQVRGHGQVPGQSTECPGSRLRAWIANGMPTEEENMPIDNDDVERFWLKDNLLPAPNAGRKRWPDNEYWAAWSAIKELIEAVWPSVTGPWEELWPGEGPVTTVGVAARRAAIEAARTRRAIPELLAGQAAIVAAINGQDVPTAIREELERHRAELRAELQDDLRELIEAAQSGELEAAQVVDEIGRRLAQS